MNEKLKEKLSPVEVMTGKFSRKEAAQLIASGTTHLHSSSLGSRDACARLTHEMMQSGKIVPYPWETENKSSSLILTNSTERHKLTHHVISETDIASKRELSERLSLVMEELMTNAIYHSYLDEAGEQKYLREHIIELKREESIKIEFSGGKKGVFLSVTDFGGTIEFNHIAQSFHRCYGKEIGQVETKASGAGLGLYMVFELVTHLKVICTPGKQSMVSCWLPDTRSYDPDYFSFNYFDGRRT